MADLDDVAAVALDGIEAAWLDGADRRTLRAGFETTLAGLREAA